MTFLLYLVLVAMITWPLLKNIRFEVLGHPALSAKVHLWQYWWTWHSLSSPDHQLSWCPMIFYPNGVNTIVKFGSYLFPLAGMPFQWAFGLIAGYSLTLMVFIAATGLATYLLCRRFVTSRLACFIAGTVYAFLPYSLMENFNGATEIAVLLWIPVCFIQLDRWLKNPSLIQGLLLGFVLFLSAMSSWYYGVYLGMAIAVAIGTYGLTAWRKKELSKVPVIRMTASLIVAGAVFGLLFGPSAMQMARSYRMKVDWRDVCTEHLTAAKANPDMAEALGPWQEPISRARTINPDVLYSYPFCIFPGFLALALGALGLGRRSSVPGYYYAVAVFFWLLSLGPWLKIAGHTYFMGFQIPLLTCAVISVWENFSAAVMHSYRTIPLSWFVLAVLAAVGSDFLIRSLALTRMKALALAVAIVLLVMADAVNSAHLGFPMARTDTRLSPVYKTLRDAPGSGAVIDIPVREQHSMHGCYLLAQIQYHRPVYLLENDRDRLSPGIRPRFLNDLELWKDREGKVGTPVDPVAGMSALRKEGFRFFVIHWSWLRPEIADNLRKVMAKHCRLLAEDGKERISVYEIVDTGRQ